MAYCTQEQKKSLAPAIKAVLKKYDVKGTIAIRNQSVLVVNIKSGVLDFIAEANRKNAKHASWAGQIRHEIKDHYQANAYNADGYEGIFGEFYRELIAAMKGNEWYDKSDAMTDYFDTAYYLNINIGKWDTPYILNAV